MVGKRRARRGDDLADNVTGVRCAVANDMTAVVDDCCDTPSAALGRDGRRLYAGYG